MEAVLEAVGPGPAHGVQQGWRTAGEGLSIGETGAVLGEVAGLK